MPCYHPLTAWRGPLLPSGKRSVVFKPGESTAGLVAFPQKLPCGQCFGCRLDYSLDWATRCMCEAQMHMDNCFITLTYADEFLPASHSHRCRRLVDKINKVYEDYVLNCARGSLCVYEFQTFMKRLRKKVGPVRFYHAGEYGEEYGRPHYHALLFGYNFPDRVPFKVTGSGEQIDTSQLLSSLWGKGYASVGNVTFESAAYVARYCMKKMTGNGARKEDKSGLAHYDRVDESTGEVVSVKPEYVTMSRRPGIARAWFDKFQTDVYPHDYSVVRGGVKMPPPRYFDGLYEKLEPELMKRIKLTRVSRCTKFEWVWNDKLQKLQKLDVNRDERLMDMELVKKAKVSLCHKMECGHD